MLRSQGHISLEVIKVEKPQRKEEKDSNVSRTLKTLLVNIEVIELSIDEMFKYCKLIIHDQKNFLQEQNIRYRETVILNGTITRLC